MLTSPQITNFLDRLQNKILPSFSLSDLPGFPFEEYQDNLSRYSELESWVNGKVLDETVQQSDKAVSLYPVKVNPIPGAIEKHTHFLFGQVSEDDRPLVNPRMIPRSDDEADMEDARVTEDVLAQIWWESNGRALQWENGAVSQSLGGCIFWATYDPFDPLLTYPIRLETVHPKFFVGVPDSGNIWKLREAWIVRPISVTEASEYGVVANEDEDTYLIQHYTLTTYDVTVNSVPATRVLPDGTRVPLSGPNIWGFIPCVYIPHVRIHGFYGQNIIDVVKGLVKEINLRVADYGDAVTVDAHAYLGMKNVNGSPVVQQLAPGKYAINVGTNPGITGQEADPDLFELGSAKASAPMKELVDLLYSMYRRLANVPAVVDGEDEGSQRSGLTLAMRMISLTSHTEAERVFWTTGLSLFNRMILRMLLIKQEAQMTIEKATLRLKLEWAPILPRDREMIVSEAVALMSAKLGSPERLLELLGVDNIPQERELILKFWDEVLNMEAEAAAKAAPPQPFGGGGGKAPSSKAEPKAKGISGSSSEAQSATKE